MASFLICDSYLIVSSLFMLHCSG